MLFLVRFLFCSRYSHHVTAYDSILTLLLYPKRKLIKINLLLLCAWQCIGWLIITVMLLLMQDGERSSRCSSSSWWWGNTLSNMSDWDGWGREFDGLCRLSESTSSSLHNSLWVDLPLSCYTQPTHCPLDHCAICGEYCLVLAVPLQHPVINHLSAVVKWLLFSLRHAD